MNWPFKGTLFLPIYQNKDKSTLHNIGNSVLQFEPFLMLIGRLSVGRSEHTRTHTTCQNIRVLPACCLASSVQTVFREHVNTHTHACTKCPQIQVDENFNTERKCLRKSKIKLL